MLRRYWIAAALATWMGASGCSGMMKKVNDPLAGGASGWAEAPAPPQQQVALPPERSDTSVATARPLGFAKYFPGLRRDTAPDPKTASTTPRTSWFSFARRSRPTPTQFYTTDVQSGLGQGMAEASALPVTLQVPTARATDAAVTPTRAEQPSTSPDLPPPAPTVGPDAPSAAGPAPTPNLGTPPAELAGPSPSPTAEAPTSPTSPVLPAPEVAVNRMPELPAVDPRERPRLSTPPPTEPQPVTETRKADDQARKAIPPETAESDDDDTTILAAFLHRLGVAGHKAPHAHPTTVLASPQVAPTPQAVVKVKTVKPKKVVTATPQARPSAQGESHACVCENCGANICKRPCILKRMRSCIIKKLTAPTP